MKEFLTQTIVLSLLRLMMDLKRYVDLGAGLCMMLSMLFALQRMLSFLS